jgi:hypothetical protein
MVVAGVVFDIAWTYAVAPATIINTNIIITNAQFQ